MTSLRAFVRHGDSSFRRFFLTSDAPLQPLKPRPQRSPISTLTHAACEGVRAHECDPREISSGSRPTSLRKKGTEVGPRFGFEFKSKALCSQSLPVAKPRSTTSVEDCERARTSKEEDQTPGAREQEHPTRWMSSTVQSRERNWCTGTTCRHRTFLAHSFESPALCLRWLPSLPRGRRFLALRARKR